jgi:hypothetical protein
MSSCAVSDSHPVREGRAVLFDRRRGDHGPAFDEVGAVGVHRGQIAVDFAALHPSAEHEMMRGPAMIGAVAIGIEGAAEF